MRTEPELLNERLDRLATVLDEIMPNCALLVRDALDLLKEQEAVKPTLIREGRNKNYNDYVCPRCDNEVVYEQNYCSECGVRFLWEGR